MIVKLRDELSRLRRFIGYNQIDTSDGETGRYDFNPKAYENIFGYENQVETDESGTEVKTLLDYIYLIVQKDLSQDKKDSDFETRVAANKTNIDKILGWLEDKKDEDGTVTTQGVLSQVKTLWSDVENVTNGLKVKVSSQDQRIKTLEDLINNGWDEENESGFVSYDGYKTTIKKIYDQLSEKATTTILTNTLEKYYTKTDADKKFVAKDGDKVLSDKNFTAEFETLLTNLNKEDWVRPVKGKGLSTEDFTTAEKNKLNGIAEGANKTEITKTLNDSETTVPSNKAVSDGLTAKVDKNNIVKTIDSSNNTALDKVPSCAAVSTALAGKLNSSSKASGIDDDNKNNDDIIPSVKAVADYVDKLGLSSLGEKPVCSQTSSSIIVSVTSKIGFVKVTSIDNFTQSKVAYNSNPSAVTLTVSGLSPSTSYFVEVYNFAGQPFKAQRITTLAENSGV